MTGDFLEQLAHLEVADVPPEFERQVHQRVNRWLLVQQLVEFVTGALPWALVRFLGAVGGVVAFSITGRFAGPRQRKRDETA